MMLRENPHSKDQEEQTQGHRELNRRTANRKRKNTMTNYTEGSSETGETNQDNHKGGKPLRNTGSNTT